MKALVFVEEHRGAPLTDSLGIISYLSAAGYSVSACYAAVADEQALKRISRSGAARILLADEKRFADFPIESNVELLAENCRRHGFDAIIFSSTVLASDIAGRLAGVLDAGIVWGISELFEEDGILIGRRQTLADTVVVDMEWTSATRIALIRPHRFEAMDFDCNSDVIRIEPPRFHGVQQTDAKASGDTPGLANASVIVAGGRGMGRIENLELVKELASVLDGAVGVSLPVVDAGWAPRSMQVGQTGTIVRANLYIACGISGQFQHKIGIEHSKTIIAINVDRNAPIVEFCDIAVIGDLATLLPRLSSLIKKRRALGRRVIGVEPPAANKFGCDKS